MENFYPNIVGEQYQKEAFCKVYRDEGNWIVSYISPRTVLRKPAFGRPVFSDQREAAKNALKDAFREKVKKAGRKAYMVKKLVRQFENLEQKQLEELSESVIEQDEKNLFLRKRRFKRKVFTNQELWNYFVTVTRDDARYADEESFRKAVDKCFSNLSTRRGWKAMGVWERGEKNDRLHFHALVAVPPGEMVGELYEDIGYSWKKGREAKVQLNKWFGKRFGRTQFEALDPKGLLNVALYIVKYLQKSFEEVRYSRGIISEGVMKYAFKDLAMLFPKEFLRGISIENLYDFVKDQRPSDVKRVQEILRIYAYPPDKKEIV